MAKRHKWPVDEYTLGAMIWRMREQVHPGVMPSTVFLTLFVEIEGEQEDHSCGPDCPCWKEHT
jgi:hypothetical protein